MVLFNERVGKPLIQLLQSLILDCFFVHGDEGRIEFLSHHFFGRKNVFKMDPGQLHVGVKHFEVILHRILADPLDYCFCGRGRVHVLIEVVDGVEDLFGGQDGYLLIPSEFPESSDCLHYFVLCHVRPQRKNCSCLRFHLYISSSRAGFVENDKGSVLRNTGITIDSGMGRYIVDFPAADIIAVENPREVELLEEMVVTDPRNNLVLQGSTRQNCSSINDAPH